MSRIELIKKDFGLFLSISFGIFLFILFFQPFPMDHLEFNNRLLFVAGIGGVFFLFMVIIRLVFHVDIPEDSDIREPILQNYLGGLILLSLTTIATSFYIRYVGDIPLSIYLVVRIVILSMIPPVAMWLYDSYKDLKNRNRILAGEMTKVQVKLDEFLEDYQNKMVEFPSENRDENFVIDVGSILLIKSSGNYVEIFYNEEGTVNKQLIRTTLRNVENLLRPFANFMRCHRTCIINTHSVQNVHRKLSNNWVNIRGISEPVPVSRQYLLKLREKI